MAGGPPAEHSCVVSAMPRPEAGRSGSSAALKAGFPATGGVRLAAAKLIRPMLPQSFALARSAFAVWSTCPEKSDSRNIVDARDRS